MDTINKNIIFVVALLFAANVHAGLISKDYKGVTGGVTFDDSTNIEWLDLSFTQSMTLIEYQQFLADNSDGWQWASSAQVSNLYSEFGITSSNNTAWGVARDRGPFYTYSSPTAAFKQTVEDLSMLGETLSLSTSFYGVRGFTSNVHASGNEQFLMYYNNSIGVVATGQFIERPRGLDYHAFYTFREASPKRMIRDVTTVSEPGTFLLIFSAIAICFIQARKRS